MRPSLDFSISAISGDIRICTGHEFVLTRWMADAPTGISRCPLNIEMLLNKHNGTLVSCARCDRGLADLEPEAKDVDPQSLRFKTEIHAPTAARSEKPPSRASPSFDRFWGRYWKTAACELPPNISVGTALAVGQERPGLARNRR